MKKVLPVLLFALGLSLMTLTVHSAMWSALQSSVRDTEYFHQPSYSFATFVKYASFVLALPFMVAGYRGIKSSAMKHGALFIVLLVIFAMACASTSVMQLIFYI